MATELNRHFASVGENLAKSLPTSDALPQCSHKFNISNELNEFSETTGSEIKDIILNLKSNVASGPDEISVNLIKNLGDPFANYIAREINNSFGAGNFPDSLKIARVVPLFKSPKKASNYRPLSILSIVSKIYETVIKSRLEKHFISNKFIHKNQFGFIKVSNTTAASTNLTIKVAIV